MSKHSARGAAWDVQRKRVLHRDGWVCLPCGKHLEGSDATVDHILPVTLDPEHVYEDDELVSMCRRCNGIKSDRIQRRMPWFNPDFLPDGLTA